MEVRNENYDEALRVMERATTLPKKTNISYHDEVGRTLINRSRRRALTDIFFQSLSVQARLFKSLKLWSFYVDLEESIGTIESTKRVYDQMMHLKIANPQVCPLPPIQ
jgi:pre-mRNA-splicing factor SYF1